MPTLDSRLTTVEKNVSTLNSTVTTQTLDVATLEQRIAKLESDLTTVQAQVVSMQGDVGNLKTDVATLKTDVATLKSQVASMRSDIAALKSQTAALESRVNGLKDDLAQRFGSLYTLSTLSNGVKKLLEWVQLPSHRMSAMGIPEKLTLSCPLGVPLNTMLFSPQGTLEIGSTAPVVSPAALSDNTTAAVVSPNSVIEWVVARAGGEAWFPGAPVDVFPYVLCLNVDALGAAPALSGSWSPQ